MDIKALGGRCGIKSASQPSEEVKSADTLTSDLCSPEVKQFLSAVYDIWYMILCYGSSSRLIVCSISQSKTETR